MEIDGKKVRGRRYNARFRSAYVDPTDNKKYATLRVPLSAVSYIGDIDKTVKIIILRED